MRNIHQIEKEIQQLTKEVEFIKQKKKEEIKSCDFKIGDYLVCIDNTKITSKQLSVGLTLGKIYTVLSEPRSFITLDGTEEIGIDIISDTDFKIIKLISRFRSANNDEIEKFLLSEAEKQGFVVGANVEYNNPNEKLEKNKVRFGRIIKLKVIFSQDNLDSNFNSDLNHEKVKEGKPFLVVQFGDCRSCPISYLKLVKEEPITMIVEDIAYQAEFKEGFVVFGCATISNHLIQAAHQFLIRYSIGCFKDSNRKVEWVKIGKGEFDLELLEKIVKRLK